MINPATMATFLRDTAAGLPGVKDARLGMNALTLTPAVEVWMEDGDTTQQRAAGQNHIREAHTFQVVFYIPLRSNIDSDEIEMAGFVTAFVDAIHSEAFDYTLGGLVETTRCTRYAFDLIARNNRPYRAGIIGVEAGEL